MIYSLQVIFGKEQVEKIYNNKPLSDEETKLNIKEYQFKSEEEKQDFLKGMNETISWVDFCIPQLEFKPSI